MTKKSSNKFAIALISFLFSGVTLVWACAGGWWSIEEATNYTPEIFVDTAYKPFYYSGDLYYYSINYDEMQNERFNETVTNDWYNWFEKKYSKSEIELFLFSTFAKTIDSLSGTSVPARFSNSSLLKSKEKKVLDFMNYLKIAKQAEMFALRGPDEWSYYYDDKPKKKRTSSAEFCSSVLNAYKNSKDKFIKERLWFQLVRGYYFNNDFTNCVSAFENRQDAVKNIMYYRCMSYAAGALMRSGKTAKANYYYSIVYNNCNELKTTAHFSFHPQEEKDWQQTLLMCKSADEKCTLWQMLGVFYKDEARSIEEIVKIDPSSPKLDLLLTRANNKIETALFSYSFTYEFSAFNDKEALKKLEELKTIFQNVIKNGNVSRPYQWYLGLGYLETLSGDFNGARGNYSLGVKSAGSNKLVAEEARLLQLINTVSEIKTVDVATENKLLAEFKWLENADKALRKNAVSIWIKKIMAKKYRAQGDLLKAEFYQTNLPFYVNETQLHGMQDFLLKKNKTPYEQYCEAIYNFKLSDLYEFEAINKALQDKTSEAIALMEKAGPTATLLSNPFNGGIKDCHDCDHALPQKTKFTKLSTLQKISEMKDKLSTDPYNNAMLIGNAYYNMTFYGSSRVFYGCAVMSSEVSTKDLIDPAFVNRLTDMTQAVKYYSMALAAAATDEQKAKCYYMLSKCQRNEWYNEGNGEGDKNFEAWAGFKELKNYSSTKYYKEVIKECGYFRKYAGR